MKKLFISLLACLIVSLSYSQDPYQTKQKISNPLTQAEANGALSVKGPMWSLLTDTIHAYAIPKYKGALIMRHADSLVYSNTGSYWRCVQQNFPVEYPLYIDYNNPSYPNGILKSATPAAANKLITTGGIQLSDHDVTVYPDIIWTFNQQVKIDNFQHTWTVVDATPGYKRIDVIYIDSLDNFQYDGGIEDTVAVFPNTPPYNAIVVTTITVFGDSAIQIDQADTAGFWRTIGNSPNNATNILGSFNDIAIRLMSNSLNIGLIDKTGITLSTNTTRSSGDKDSYTLTFRGGNLNEFASSIGMDVLGSTYGLAFSSGNYSFGGDATGTMSHSMKYHRFLTVPTFLFNSSGSSPFLIENEAAQSTGVTFQVNKRNQPANTSRPLLKLSPTGQLLIGDNIGSITSSANLELSNTDGGLLINRVTTTQRDAISSPATSLLVYNTTTSTIQKYNGSAWQNVERPYKIYSAIITQSGTSAPVATVLENSTGVTITWSRNSAGDYTGLVSSGIFDATKTWIMANAGAELPGANVPFISIIRKDVDNIQMTTGTFNASTGVFTKADGVVTSQAISVEIRLYN